LLLALMAFTRLSSLEQLRYVAPREWPAVERSALEKSNPVSIRTRERRQNQ
jgi:hypothetical protein